MKRKAENRPGLARFLKELNAATFKPANAVTIGEASGVAYDELGDFIGPNGYFSMIFDFHYADIDVASGSEWFKQTQWTPKMLGDAIAKVSWPFNASAGELIFLKIMISRGV